MTLTVDQVYRDNKILNNPSSGQHEPVKSEVRAFLKGVMNRSGQAVTRNTLTALQAVTPPNENYMGVVLTGADAGYYSRSGAAWVFGRPFADTFAQVDLAGSGTAQTGSLNTGVNPAGVEVFFAKVETPNTGQLTLSISGGPARSVRNLAGNPLSAGEWTGMVMFYLNEDGQYQLLIDAGAAASAAASATSANADADRAGEEADRAEEAAAAALAAVSGGTSIKATVAAAIADEPDVDPAYYDIAYYDTSYQTGSGAKYRKVNAEPAHPGKFQNANGVWYEIDALVLLPEMFGATGDGVTDDTPAWRKMAEVSTFLRRQMADRRTGYFINPLTTIECTEDATFLGYFIVPKNNTVTPFRWERDNKAGTVLSTAAWVANLTRGLTEIGAVNASGKTVVLSSTEVLIQRIGAPHYLKTETVQVHSQDGSLSRGLVCSYTSKANLTATAYDPDRPIRVAGISFLYTGTEGNGPDGVLHIRRDHVTVDFPRIHVADPTNGIVTGFYSIDCVGTIWNNPVSSGFGTPGTGYGIQGSRTLGMRVYDAEMLDARHAFSGRNNTDCVIDGGRWSIIDDHWCENFTIKNCTVRTRAVGEPVLWIAGNDLHVENVSSFGGRGFLGIRLDTPHLGGTVMLRDIKCFSRGVSAHGQPFDLVAYTSREGDFAPGRTDRVSLADKLHIENITIDCDADAWLLYSGAFKADHQSWGEIHITGTNKAVGPNGKSLGGVFAYKEAVFATGRTPRVTIDGCSDFTGAQFGVFIAALDTSDSRAWNVSVSNMRATQCRFSPYSVSRFAAHQSTIGSVLKHSGEAGGNHLYTFDDCDMTGGEVGAFTNLGFFNCRFMNGSYTSFPSSPGAMIGNVRASTVTGLPTDIRNNVVSPFA
ncbi:MAG TPA: hypothetical protein VIL88_14785 [Devosia sp.]|jgi:hypothetical protein|uniref:hypothetical protein n=1 Tax=Devosia sp. TaxID=1871048 RepID=UPI002F9431A3